MLYACLISCGDDRHDHENHQSNNRKPASHDADAGEDDYSYQELGAREKGYRSNERVASSLFYK